MRRGASRSVNAAAEFDALPYLRSNSIAITLDVSGALPTEAWKMDLAVCVSGTVRYAPEL